MLEWVHVLIKVLAVILGSGRHEAGRYCVISELSTRLGSEAGALVHDLKSKNPKMYP